MRLPVFSSWQAGTDGEYLHLYPLTHPPPTYITHALAPHTLFSLCLLSVLIFPTLSRSSGVLTLPHIKSQISNPVQFDDTLKRP